jgi:hypothetical protein
VWKTGTLRSTPRAVVSSCWPHAHSYPEAMDGATSLADVEGPPRHACQATRTVRQGSCSEA